MDAGPLSRGQFPAREYERSGRTETNEAWRSYGRLRWPMSTGKAVDSGHAMLFSAGMFGHAHEPAHARSALALWPGGCAGCVDSAQG